MLKKIILSDYLAVNFVDRVFNNPLLFTGFENLSALFIYSLQVYADFSGYTDIAIGVAMLMGFYLPVNFNSPYKATNPGNFWKRWHISLSTWLKDYLYIPLGGNRTASVGTFVCIISIVLIAVMLSGSIYVAGVTAVIALILWLLGHFFPERKKKIITNINLMNTMLLGGLWHGASWNFMIWGGLNGIGVVLFKYWRNWSDLVRVILTGLLFGLFVVLEWQWPAPVVHIGLVWTGVIFFGTLVSAIYSWCTHGKIIGWVQRAWSILLTFVFITFTRLFFRSGSNLNPAEANETAWNTAKNMVNQIGSKWDIHLIPNIVYEYRYVFLMFLLGMIIHWLPTNWKRWYRLNFAMLPLWVMGLAVIATVFVLYQFITADLQPFIYFQF